MVGPLGFQKQLKFASAVQNTHDYPKDSVLFLAPHPFSAHNSQLGQNDI